jgi:hypothetical protein
MRAGLHRAAQGGFYPHPLENRVWRRIYCRPSLRNGRKRGLHIQPIGSRLSGRRVDRPRVPIEGYTKRLVDFLGVFVRQIPHKAKYCRRLVAAHIWFQCRSFFIPKHQRAPLFFIFLDSIKQHSRGEADFYAVDKNRRNLVGDSERCVGEFNFCQYLADSLKVRRIGIVYSYIIIVISKFVFNKFSFSYKFCGLCSSSNKKRGEKRLRLPVLYKSRGRPVCRYLQSEMIERLVRSEAPM